MNFGYNVSQDVNLFNDFSNLFGKIFDPCLPKKYEVVSPNITPKAVITPKSKGFNPFAAKLIKIKWYGIPVKVDIPPIIASTNMSAYAFWTPKYSNI